MKDFYVIFEVPPDASQDAIREQYHFLIQAWHPDKFSNSAQKAKAEEKSKDINIAYAVLKDPEKRAQYDSELRRHGAWPSEQTGRPRPQSDRKQTVDAAQREAQQRQQQKRAQTEARAELEREEAEIARLVAEFQQQRRRSTRRPPTQVNKSSQVPIRVLVVDDVKDTRRHIRELLSTEPDIAVVGEASDGDEAIEQYAALLPDVMTTCISMPRMNGIAATEAICQKHPGASVVIISVMGANYVRRAMTAGACDFLTKPPERGKLAQAIRRAAGRTTFAPEGVSRE